MTGMGDHGTLALGQLRPVFHCSEREGFPGKFAWSPRQFAHTDKAQFLSCMKGSGMSKLPVSAEPVILIAEECARGTLREENRESVLHVHIALGELLIVADSVGASTAGAAASRMTVEQFYAHLAALPADYTAASALREAAARANEKILEAAHVPGSPHQSMGSTMVVALLQQGAEGTHAWVGHIGDSRAYLVRAGHLYRLTIDHSAAQVLLSRSLITPEEAQNHPGAAVLTRSLGQQPAVEIEIEQHPLAVGDTLLLCSDGLWGTVPEREILRVASAPGFTVEAAAHNLLELALAAGSHDNVGIEMARLVQLTDSASSSGSDTRLSGAKLVLIMVLVAIIAMSVLACVLAYLAFWAP
jgi:protein phosphatase